MGEWKEGTVRCSVPAGAGGFVVLTLGSTIHTEHEVWAVLYDPNGLRGHPPGFQADGISAKQTVASRMRPFAKRLNLPVPAHFIGEHHHLDIG